MNTEAGIYELISLGRIAPSTTNPRKNFDDASMAELTASVREAGVQSPILLRPMYEGFARAGYQIVCGERRFRAATAAGLETIPAIVRELDDAAAYQAQIIENLQREGLGPMEEAESYAVLARSGVAAVDIAAKVGKAAPYVYQRMQLLKLVKRGKEALVSGKLLLGHAIEVAKLADAEQGKTLEYCLEGWRNVKLSDLKEFIQREFRLRLAKAPFSVKDAGMHPTAGACVDCSKRTGADALLFSDVKEGDSCLDAKCYRVKVETVIHVRVEELKKTQATVPLLTHSYQVQKGQPAGTLGHQDYDAIGKGKPCDAALMGVMIDGEQAGRKVKVCIEKKCKAHHHSSESGLGSEARKKQAAKERRDGEVRVRTASAIVDAIQSSRLMDDDVNIEDGLALAEYAFHRMDHTQDSRLAKVLGWDRAAMGHRSTDREDMLAGMGMRKAVALAVLATVASELNAQHTSHDSGRPEGLILVAGRNGVDFYAIEAAVDAEIKAKLEKKAMPAAKKATAEKIAGHAAKRAAKSISANGKKAPKKLSPEARKQIAANMKKRWAAARKKASAKL